MIEQIKKEIGNVQLLVATKGKNIQEIKKVNGVTLIGENYVQEAESKFNGMRNDYSIHLIGKLQFNKVKKAVNFFDLIQTVDSLRIAKEIDKRCKENNKIMPILIQVNIDKENNKNGCLPEEVINLSGQILKLKNVKLKGLMTISPNSSDEGKLRFYFRKTKSLVDELKKIDEGINILSMGMSDSYQIAIEEGATMVRIGKKIFENA